MEPQNKKNVKFIYFFFVSELNFHNSKIECYQFCIESNEYIKYVM